MIDDPLKPEEALSTALRRACNEWYDHTLYSRLNDKRYGRIVIIMQRLRPGTQSCAGNAFNRCNDGRGKATQARS